MKRFCDLEILVDEIVAEVSRFYDYRERVIAFLEEKLSAESDFEEIADCLEEYCEPNTYTGIKTTLFDFERKTSSSTDKIVMEMD